jgi:sorbitol/mannitol transport system substrate-binding protein
LPFANKEWFRRLQKDAMLSGNAHKLKLSFYFFLTLAFFTSFDILSHQACANQTVRLVTSEREPYIGENIPGNGYVYELIKEAFQKVGYDVEIVFYPLARAHLLAEQGKVDGILPVHYDESLLKTYSFSDPFPGGVVGLLKRKSMNVEYKLDAQTSITETLNKLKNYTFGILRGSLNTPEFDRANFLKKEEVNNDRQNLEKLFLNRVDLVVIDKYTAADLMVSHYPQMIGDLEFLDPPLAKKSFHVAFSKNSKQHQKILEAFNKGLKEMTVDKSLDKKLYKYGLLDPVTKSKGKTVIRIVTVDNPDMNIMQKLSKEYEQKHPEIKLEWKVLDENILRLRLMSDIAISDGKYDIMTIGSYEAPFWGENGWILPIKKLPNWYDSHDVIQSVRDAVSYKGILYALTFYAESTMTYYRKDLFKKAGITMPKAPTYNDIAGYAKALHDPAHNVYGICLRGKPGWGENMGTIGMLANAFGGRWFDKQWHPELDSKEWYEAVQYYKDILKKYGPPDTRANGFTENLHLFADGQCGMWIDATVAAGMLFNPKMSKVANEVGFAAAPSGRNPKGTQWLWSWALAISSSSKVPEQALQFITWATSKEYIKLVAKENGWVSIPPGTRLSTYDNPNYKLAAPFADFVLKAIQSSDPNNNTMKPVPYSGVQYVSIPEFSSIGTSVGNIIVNVLDNDRSTEDVLKESQDLVYSQMKKSGYIKN